MWKNLIKNVGATTIYKYGDLGCPNCKWKDAPFVLLGFHFKYKDHNFKPCNIPLCVNCIKKMVIDFIKSIDNTPQQRTLF